MIVSSAKSCCILLFQCAVLVMLTGCYEKSSVVSGYVESKPIYVSSQGRGIITAMPVVRGQSVTKGQLLYEMDSAYQKDQVARAKAMLALAEADYQNIMQGADKEVIASAEAMQHKAQIDYGWSKRQYERLLKLKKDQFVSPSELDSAESTMHAREKGYEEAKQNYLHIIAPPRKEVVAMKKAQVAACEAELAQAEWLLSQQTIYAPEHGTIGDVFINRSEEALPSKPVLSLYDQKAKDIVFYLPYRFLPYNKVGDKVMVDCPSCASKTAEGEITYMSDLAEFTPPLVYSAVVNDKYVYFTKARLVHQEDNKYFRYGQPVTVQVAGAH